MHSISKKLLIFMIICLSLSVLSGCSKSPAFMNQEEWNKFNEERYSKYGYQYELVQISNTKDMYGKFFLACGTIKDIPYYYVYVNNGKGIELLKLKAESDDKYKITIYQDAEKPYVKSTHTGNCGGINCNCHREYIEIHIPPGSMVQNIDINSGNFK